MEADYKLVKYFMNDIGKNNAAAPGVLTIMAEINARQGG